MRTIHAIVFIHAHPASGRAGAGGGGTNFPRKCARTAHGTKKIPTNSPEPHHSPPHEPQAPGTRDPRGVRSHLTERVIHVHGTR